MTKKKSVLRTNFFSLITNMDSFLQENLFQKKKAVFFFHLNSTNNIKVKGKNARTKETQTILLTFKEQEKKKVESLGDAACLSLFIYLISRPGAAPVFRRRIFLQQLSILWSRNCISVHWKSG